MRIFLIALAAIAMPLMAQQTVMGAAQPAWGRILQVFPDGVLTAYCSKGIISDQPCFIASDTTNLVEGLWWRTKMTPAGTYTYADATGASRTVRRFTANMIEAVKVPQFDPMDGTASSYWQEHGIGN